MVNDIRTTSIISIQYSIRISLAWWRNRLVEMFNVSTFSSYLVFLWTPPQNLWSTLVDIIWKIFYVYIATYDELEINFIKCLNYTTKSIKKRIKIASGGTSYITLLLYAIICIFFSSFTLLTILAYLCIDMFYILGFTTHFGSDENENKLNWTELNELLQFLVTSYSSFFLTL